MRRNIILAIIALLCSDLNAQLERVRNQTKENYPFEIGFHAVDGKSDRSGSYVLERGADGEVERKYCYDRRKGSKNFGRLCSGALHPSLPESKVLSDTEARTTFKRFQNKLKKFHGEEKFQLLQSWATKQSRPSERQLEKTKGDADFTEQISTLVILENIHRYLTKK